ncbi:MAG: FecR domain-containing protein [Verrucomicrobiota bacterium]
MEKTLTELCGKVRDDSISPEELHQLEALIQANPEARDYYVHFMTFHALLEDLPPVREEGESNASPRVTFLPVWAALAGVGVATMILSFLLVHRSDDQTPTVATLLFSEDCRWKSPQAPEEGQRLREGRLELKQGIAVLRSDSGAEVILSGPTQLDLVSASHAKLHFGEVVVRAEQGAEGFTVGTPASDMVDLGTEFAVRVERSGTTELHVHDGEVVCRDQILTAGQAVRFPKARSEPEPLDVAAPRFAELVGYANPQPREDLRFAYEGFHYPAGILPLSESDTGKGWNGPWRLRLSEERQRPDEEPTPDHLRIVSGQMNVTWPVRGGQLGMLELPGNCFYVRGLDRPLDLAQDDVFFFSLMVKETERFETPAKPQEAVRLTFRDSRSYFGPAISFGHGPLYEPRVQSGRGVLFTSPFVLPPEQTTLWIGKILSSRQGEDEVFFRIYGEQDELDFAEPRTWHVTTRHLRLDSRIDRVILSSTGKSVRIVDELRIGPSWRSVAPMKTEP